MLTVLRKTIRALLQYKENTNQWFQSKNAKCNFGYSFLSVWSQITGIIYTAEFQNWEQIQISTLGWLKAFRNRIASQIISFESPICMLKCYIFLLTFFTVIVILFFFIEELYFFSSWGVYLIHTHIEVMLVHYCCPVVHSQASQPFLLPLLWLGWREWFVPFPVQVYLQHGLVQWHTEPLCFVTCYFLNILGFF